ncbi:MAG: isoprenoid biosynthesis glyoxalase ElbB [Thermodesulfobacteriota bacterium]|nr:isoprenoid biosynthesis glyoxalase ElbB [Thermodesulfobacteriota bacterium]
MSKKSIAVILSGCGHQDGAEIHEATLTLWAIHKNGADYQCYAPDIAQHHVLNHTNGKEMDEQRNVLIESARIARGNILDVADFQAASHDALVIPGGFGAAKNLSTYAFEGSDCKVNEDVQKAILSMAAQKKPIGALCIAPVILAKLLDQVLVTIGQDPATIANIETMNARHSTTMQGEIAVDKKRKVVTTPCYMLDSRVDQIGEGADNLVQEILKLMNS